MIELERWLIEVSLEELVALALLRGLQQEVSCIEDSISQQNGVNFFDRALWRELANVAPLQLPFVLIHELVWQDQLIFCSDFLDNAWALLFEVLGMLLQARKNGGSVEIVLE